MIIWLLFIPFFSYIFIFIQSKTYKVNLMHYKQSVLIFSFFENWCSYRQHVILCFTLLFIQNISPPLIASNPPANQFFITNWRLPYSEDGTNIRSIRRYICLKTRLFGQQWTLKEWHSRLSVDEIAEFLTNWEQMNECYLLFKEYLKEKTSVYILKPCQELGQSFRRNFTNR